MKDAEQMNFTNNDRGYPFYDGRFSRCQRHPRVGRERSLLLVMAVLSACRGMDSKSHDAESDRATSSIAAPAATSGDAPGAGERFAVHASRIGGSARRAPAALIGTPPPIPASTQFDITGFLQEAHTTGPHTAGSLTVNGHVVTIPANTIV